MPVSDYAYANPTYELACIAEELGISDLAENHDRYL